MKTFRDSGGCIIVPARASDSDAIDRLAGVLEGLRPLGQPIVLVAQLDASSRAAFAALAAGHGPAVRAITLDRPVGKWPAVGHALPLLSGGEGWVAVFDGDGAFSATDLPALVEPIAAGRAVHAIGRRPERSLSLEAVGQASARSRIHVEAFFNTVTLLTLGVTDDDALCGFDIQCGLHVFAAARCARIAGGALPFYGGELLLFFETVEAGGTVAAADVAVGVNPPSAYRMSDIVDGLLGLRFIRTAGRRHFDRALTVAPRWYKSWGFDREEFENEIRATVFERAVTAGGTPRRAVRAAGRSEGHGMDDANVIDADGHVLEPSSLWDRHLDARYKEFAPRIVRNAWGLDTVFVGTQEIVTAPLGLLGTPGSRMDEIDPERRVSWEDAHPGGFDPQRRLADMDLEGIDVAVLYPSLGLNFWAIESPAVATALARAYNDWLAEYCGADPRRLVGAAMLPFQDPEAAALELRRAVREHGHRAAFVRPNPCCGRHIGDRVYEPVWAAAEELGVTIGVHEGSSHIISTLGADRYFNPLLLHAASHAFEQMLACATLIVTGVMERHPGLHFAFLEAGGGWAPYWLWRLDEQVRGFGRFAPEMPLKPSEYFKRQCWVAFEADEETLPALVPYVGEDRIVWGSDYPHHDATFPGAVTKLEAATHDLSAGVRRRIMRTNAQELYRLRETGAVTGKSS